MSNIEWISDAINGMSTEGHYSLSLSSVSNTQLMKMLVRGGKANAIAGSQNLPVLVEFHGNSFKEENSDKIVTDENRRNCYTRLLNLYCGTAKYNFQEDGNDPEGLQNCRKVLKDIKTINIELVAMLGETKVSIGAVTFRSDAKTRLIWLIYIAVAKNLPNAITDVVDISMDPKDVMAFLLAVMKLAHLHHSVLPSMEDVYTSFANDWLTMLDVYIYTFLVEDDREQIDLFRQLQFSEWEHIDCLLDDVLVKEANQKMKSGNNILLLQKGAFLC